MPVITVSGALVSGAREIAQSVAAELHLEYVDHEILVQAARELGVAVSDVERRDERTSTIGERLGGVLRSLMEWSAAAGASDPVSGGLGLEAVLARTYGEAAALPSQPQSGQLDEQRYIKTLKSVIKGLAARDNVVLLGRGAQAILQHEPGVLHVYVAAPSERRIDNLVAQSDVSRDDAAKRIEHSDRHRQEFHRKYFKVDGDSPQLYDLGINAGRVTIPTATKMIAIAAAGVTPRPG
jgi:cytidylate kinase